jgi:hypothetical protein
VRALGEMKEKVFELDILLWLLGAAVILCFHGLMYEGLRRSGPFALPKTPTNSRTFAATKR